MRKIFKLLKYPIIELILVQKSTRRVVLFLISKLIEFILLKVRIVGFYSLV